MADPLPERATSRWVRPFVALLIVAGLLTVVTVGIGVVRRTLSFAGFGPPAPPRVSHDLVLQQLRDVAKLVSTEMTMRDVVVYEQTRYGSTKRALLVVTGKVSAGIDLQAASVRIDSTARRIIITMPPARILGVEVLDVRTYDESDGLLNPFRAEDRDAIQRQVRHKLFATGEQSGLLAHADASARQMLSSLLARDGYTVEFARSAVLTPAPG